MNTFRQTVIILALLMLTSLSVAVMDLFAGEHTADTLVTRQDRLVANPAQTPLYQSNATDYAEEPVIELHIALTGGVKLKTACHCPFSSFGHTPFANNQVIGATGHQLYILSPYQDEQSGKPYTIAEQPFRPPIA